MLAIPLPVAFCSDSASLQVDSLCHRDRDNEGSKYVHVRVVHEVECFEVQATPKVIWTSYSPANGIWVLDLFS